MSSSNVDKIVKIYKNLARIPALIGAKLTNNQQLVASVWSQRNLERGKSMKFLRNLTIDQQLNKQTDLPPIDISSELLSSLSPTEQYRAVLRDLNEKQYLEIWENSTLSRVVDLNVPDLHGNVYTDGEFGTFQWSPDETKLLYIAEQKPPKSEPFCKRNNKKHDDKKSETTTKPGEEYLFVQDWGEQLVGKKKSIIVQYNLQTDNIEIVDGIPDDICPAQVVYSPDGTYVVGVAYQTKPRKLGLIYCTNRVGTIFKLDFNRNYVALNLDNKSVKSPIFTLDGQSLIWLQRNAAGPHAGAVALMKASLPLTAQTAPAVVVDIVKTDVQIENGRKFYGLFNSGFVKRCFATNNRLLLSTNQQNTINSYIVDVNTGKITELLYNEDDGGSLIVLDVCNDIVLANCRNFLKQDRLIICKLPENHQHSIIWNELTTNSIVPALENCIYEYLYLTQNTNDSVKNSTAIYLGPKTGEENKSVGLIVWPHGGPHSAFANNLSLEASLFLSLGYAVVFVNYRGSIGAGQDNVEFLLGKIGVSDVADCILAIQSVLERYQFLDSTKLVLVGGSHGGFLVTHLSGQYPDMFKAVVARNPVIDVASMSVISDIPDWCYVEAGYEYTQKGAINNEILMAMRKASPIQHCHQVKAPTLLQVGSKDLRVPPHQALEYYTRLKANGVTVRMNLYDDNHPLGAVPNETDQLINTVLWIQQHLN